jgi:predicted homoserine dehydrogenase-like protein
MELLRKLRARHEAHDPIRVGIVGCGQMGSGLAHATSAVQGMRVAAIADIDPARAIATFVDLGHDRADVVVTDAEPAAAGALAAGRPLVTADALLLTRLERLEANVEATGVPDVGARVAYESIANRKPVIMLNVETDVTVGLYLSSLAREAGTVYTVASGDEPGVCKMLYEQAVLMGFEVVCLGKGKNNVIDFDATPESCADEAASKGMNPKMLAAFKDGTKTMVEMTAVANSTGLLPDVPGMHGPNVDVHDLDRVYIPASDGGILGRRGCVDYSTGPIAPGVFAVVYSDNDRIRTDMRFITHAEGPYYLHFRPYHLCDLETPQSIAEAVLMGEVTVAAEGRHAEVVAIAKRDIRAGQRVGSIGGPDYFGRIHVHEDLVRGRLVPIGIAEGGVAIRDIAKGSPISLDAFAPDDTTFVADLRRRQDLMP